MDTPYIKNIPTLQARREFIFIHGYTGSTGDFGGLPKQLHDKFGATVSCLMLPGHGTSIEDLVGLTHQDLFDPIELQIQEAVRKGSQVVLVGLSMGAQAALYFASKYPVRGVIAIATTHTLRFPLNLTSAGIASVLKKRWKKRLTPVEEQFRSCNKGVYYDEMLSDGWFISRKLRDLVIIHAKHITQPVLFIHSAQERLANPSALEDLAEIIAGHTTIRLLQNTSHNVFYSSVSTLACAHISAFIREMKLFQDNPRKEPYREKVSAVIPAYNEAARIEAVLTALSTIPFINEIIVIDDGSSDDTIKRVRTFRHVTLLVNKQNIGKGRSLDLGVVRAKNDVIFFCDADLTGFTAQHAEAIIRPVLIGTHDMYIGMRCNFMQRAVMAWGLNSGERALRKEMWHTLPDYYKYRYRIEVGLNRHVKEYGLKGLGWKIFDYTQPIKESKYGLLRGAALRLWMNFDVLCAYFMYPLIRLTALKNSEGTKGGNLRGV